MLKKDELIVKGMNVLPWAGFILLCISGAAGKEEGFGAEQLTVALLFATLILTIRREKNRQVAVQVILSLFALAAFSVSALPFIGGLAVSGISVRIFIPVVVTVIVTQVDICCRSSRRYRNIRTLFKNSLVVDNIVCQASMHRCLMMYSACIIMTMASVRPPQRAAVVLYAVASAILCFLCVLMLLSPARMIFVGKNKYLQVMSMARGRLKDNLLPEEAEGSDMKRTYAKAQECMEKMRMYLDPDLSLEDVARELGTNKVYLSRTINVVSGRNFCQFVNYYRVQFAKDLMLREPHSKMIEIAMASGFHSVVTFNMAFKVNEETTPSEWLHEYASVSLPHLSKNPEQGTLH